MRTFHHSVIHVLCPGTAINCHHSCPLNLLNFPNKVSAVEPLHNFNEADPLLGSKPYVVHLSTLTCFRNIHRYLHGHSPRLVEYKQYRCPFIVYELSNFKHLLFALATITFRVTTLIVVLLSVVSVYLCLTFNITAEMTYAIIIPAIVFPISFRLPLNFPSLTFQCELHHIKKRKCITRSGLFESNCCVLVCLCSRMVPRI